MIYDECFSSSGKTVVTISITFLEIESFTLKPIKIKTQQHTNAVFFFVFKTQFF